MKKRRLWSFLLLLAPAAARADTSLSADYARMMTWLSQQMVDPLAFNAGTTFDPPIEIRPGRIVEDVSFGVGIVPLDSSKFPQLANPTLNAQNVSASFPQQVPFPDFTTHVRVGLPWRSDLGVRFTDTTIPTITVTPGTAAGAQANNAGVEFRKFFAGQQDEPKFELAAHANHLWGNFTFANTFANVDLDGITANASNKGTMQWNLTSIGLDAIVSRPYGNWTPYGGIGFNAASGTMSSKLNTTFDTFLATPSESDQSATPSANNWELLFGTQLRRNSGHDLFVAGELLLTGGQRAFNVHIGMVLPKIFGKKQKEEAAKAPVILGQGSPKKLADQNLIFIK